MGEGHRQKGFGFHLDVFFLQYLPTSPPPEPAELPALEDE